jgi:hypothetical protein
MQVLAAKREFLQFHNLAISTNLVFPSAFRVYINKKDWIRQLAESLRTIKEQLDITIEHYKRQVFNESYTDVSWKACAHFLIAL